MDGEGSEPHDLVGGPFAVIESDPGKAPIVAQGWAATTPAESCSPTAGR